MGERCELQSWVRVVDSTIEDDCIVKNCCVVTEARLASGTVVGPFAHLRPGSILEFGARVGNFVEMKQATLGRGSKANHLSYLGDATVGDRVNVGAGTITCNYDGGTKNRTTIADGAFVGSGTQTRGTGHGGTGWLRRRRVVYHRGRAPRFTRRSPSATGKQTRVGGKKAQV